MSFRGRRGVRSHRWRSRRQEGQATVELALALPVVVMVLLLVIQVAVIGRSQVLVVNAAREGARAMAANEGAGAASSAARATPGLDPSAMTVTVAGGSTPGSTVTVTVRYRAPTDVALIGPLLGEPVLEASVTMRLEEHREPVPMP